MRPLNPSSEKAYARILHNAFGGASPALEALTPRLEGWSNSRRVALKAALKRRSDVPEHERTRILAAITPRWEPRRQVVALSEEEAKSYEREARKLPHGKKELALLPLAVGLRASELLLLDRAAVTRATRTGELLVMRKGAHEQILPVSHCRSLFSELLKVPRPPNEAMQVEWEVLGEILSQGVVESQYRAFYELVRRVGETAGLPNLHPHSLRHAFATRLMRDGAPLPTIQAALGHRRIETTMLYVHAAASDIAKYTRRF